MQIDPTNETPIQPQTPPPPEIIDEEFIIKDINETRKKLQKAKLKSIIFPVLVGSCILISSPILLTAAAISVIVFKNLDIAKKITLGAIGTALIGISTLLSVNYNPKNPATIALESHLGEAFNRLILLDRAQMTEERWSIITKYAPLLRSADKLFDSLLPKSTDLHSYLSTKVEEVDLLPEIRQELISYRNSTEDRPLSKSHLDILNELIKDTSS